jgi:hypothetical protein
MGTSFAVLQSRSRGAHGAAEGPLRTSPRISIRLSRISVRLSRTSTRLSRTSIRLSRTSIRLSRTSIRLSRTSPRLVRTSTSVLPAKPYNVPTQEAFPPSYTLCKFLMTAHLYHILQVNEGGS